MSITIVKGPHERKKRKIYSITKALELLPRTTVEYEDNFDRITVKSQLQCVPNFLLEWAGDGYGYFRVYIHLAEGKGMEKIRLGYPILNIRSELVASGFTMFVNFLFKNRAYQSN